MKTLLGQGAEATVYLEDDSDSVTKIRTPKSYRHPEIDRTLRFFRAKREAKMLETLKKIGLAAPLLRMHKEVTIEMDFIQGELLKNILSPELAREVGQKAGILHKNNIIHGDLTTSNMILNKEVHFIDFGLSFFSQKIEDKAVDLHLLRCALESKHWNMYEQCFAAVLEGYKETNPDYAPILEKMQEVEGRGRNKHKI